MKNRLFIFLILLTPLSIYSQVINEYGVKGGLNFSYQTAYWDAMSFGNSDHHLGYNVAAYISLINNKHFNILLEPGLIQKGFSQNFENYGKVNPSLTYFSFSIIGKPKISYKTFTTYLLIGASFNHLISKNEDIFNGIYQNVKSNTISLDFGVGLQKSMTKKYNMFFELKYDYEIQDNPIHNFNYNGITYFFEYGQSFRNKSVELLLGFGFH